MGPGIVRGQRALDLTANRGARLEVTIESAKEIFELTLSLTEADIDELDHVNNTVYLRWVQEAAVAHWRHAATATQQAEIVWVVLRHEIDYKRPARLGDLVKARTWVGTASTHAFDRHTEIVRDADGRLLARARTVWCPIDLETGRPMKVGDDVRRRFSVPAEPGDSP
jgi:acyl-CoA thioester hydrolase